MKSKLTRSAEIRARLNHPIIDSDGHIAEFEPALLDYLEREAGAALADRIRRIVLRPLWYRATPDERRRTVSRSRTTVLHDSSRRSLCGVGRNDAIHDRDSLRACKLHPGEPIPAQRPHEA